MTKEASELEALYRLVKQLTGTPQLAEVGKLLDETMRDLPSEESLFVLKEAVAYTVKYTVIAQTLYAILFSPLVRQSPLWPALIEYISQWDPKRQSIIKKHLRSKKMYAQALKSSVFSASISLDSGWSVSLGFRDRC